MAIYLNTSVVACHAIVANAHLSTCAAADALNGRGIRIVSGNRWHAVSVHRVRHRFGYKEWLQVRRAHVIGLTLTA
jgi:hypothetical protein